MAAIEKRILVARKKAEYAAKGMRKRGPVLTDEEWEKVKKYILKLRT